MLSRPRVRRWLSPALLFCFTFMAVAAACAAPITGTVMNMTTHKPAVGDNVVLIRLTQGMQEETHTTTDAKGRFSLDVPDANSVHLVRVTHERANYFQPARPGTREVNLIVYDSAEQVAGVSTEADVMRIDTEQGKLRVIENFFVKNVSSPPRTQFSAHPFTLYLPAGAQILSSAALGPGSVPVQSAPVPMGNSGQYTFIFPLRPGETRFQVSYSLPYSGNFRFQARVGMPVDNFAIILPKSMEFTSIPATAFQPVDQDARVQTFLAKNVTPDAQLRFQVAGTGQLPQENANGQNAQGNAQGNAQANAQGNGGTQPAAADNRPGGGLGVPIDTPDPLHKYQWWIISLVVLLLAVGGAVSIRHGRTQPEVALAGGPTVGAGVVAAGGGAPSAGPGPPGLLAVLKEELFTLETERVEGRISAEEYDRHKAAIEVVLKRALGRNPGAPPGAVTGQAS